MFILFTIGKPLWSAIDEHWHIGKLTQSTKWSQKTVFKYPCYLESKGWHSSKQHHFDSCFSSLRMHHFHAISLPYALMLNCEFSHASLLNMHFDHNIRWIDKCVFGVYAIYMVKSWHMFRNSNENRNGCHILVYNCIWEWTKS